MRHQPRRHPHHSNSGPIHLTATRPGLEPATAKLDSTPVKITDGLKQ